MPDSIPHPIRIIDLPGFKDIEAKILIYYHPGQPVPPLLDHHVDVLSKQTFGTTSAEVWDLLDLEEEDDGESTFAAVDGVEAFADNCDEVGRSDDDAVVALKLLGLDFSDAKGWPLPCTRFFKWQALAAATGVLGAMPDPAAAGLKRMEVSLEEEAKRFSERKRGR